MLLHNPAIPFLGIYIKDIKTFSHKCFHVTIHIMTIHNSQNMDITQMSTNRWISRGWQMRTLHHNDMNQLWYMQSVWVSLKNMLSEISRHNRLYIIHSYDISRKGQLQKKAVAGSGVGIAAYRLKGTSWNDGSILKFRCGYGCTTVCLYKIIRWILCYANYNSRRWLKSKIARHGGACL